MSVSIIQRPQGHVLSTTENIAIVTDDYGGVYALFTKANHGLTTGNFIYVDSNIETYNGFKYVQVINTNSFRVKVYALADPAEYIQDTSVSYYLSTQTHGWSCVHLPIVYRLSNNRYPVNSIDAIRTVNTLANSGGYARITLSGSLGTFEELAFVKISNAPDSDLDGVYQIIDKISTSDVVLSLTSTVTNAELLGASIQLYYSNYNINVRIYAGLNASHQWASQKPYELAATIQLIPDANNEVKFSVSEILKSYINTRNNLQLPTLPNNIDFFTQFYIEVSESFDEANGYSVSTFLDSFTSDQGNFEGVAVNAKLPFKNIHSGYLSDYIMTNATAKFLTLFTLPVLFGCSDDMPDCYSDISILKDTDSNLVLKKEYLDASGVTQVTEIENITGEKGLYRLPISANCTYKSLELNIVSWILSGSDLPDYAWSSIAYGNGLFVAVSSDGTVMSSVDGVTWVERTAASANQWNAVTFGNGLFVAVSGTGTGDRVMTSANGVDWTSQSSAADNNWSSVTFGNGLFVAVASSGTGNRVMTSPDGETWTIQSSAEDNDWSDVVYGNGLFVAVASSGTGNRVMTSPDGENWTIQSSAADVSWSSIDYGNGLFVAVSRNNSDKTMTSTDGINWTARDIQTGRWSEITFGNGVFVTVQVVGSATTAISKDGINWFYIDVPPSIISSQFTALAFGDGTFVAVSNIIGTGVSYAITLGGLSKTFTIDCGCSNQEMRLSWLNYLGGFDYWNFLAEKEHSIDVIETGETKSNIFPNWPDSYGEHADSIRKQTHRDSRKQVLVRSQYLTLDEIEAIKFIRTSPLVQIVNSRKDRRTVIVDSDSFTVFSETDKLYSIQFTISYTDDIPSQRI
jgi:hypothetical protein